MGLTFEKARALADAAVAKATEMGLPVTIAIVDQGGHVVCKYRMDGATYLTGRAAEDKAYTSAGLGIATADIQGLIQPGGPVFGLNMEHVATFGGGLPLRDGKALVGGIGVSGGSVDQDAEIASAAIAAAWA
ncbi:MAG: heme-binding protein [Thermoleophilia bacterium]